ncbi:MAG: FAD-binding oxidoreductase [Desulfohalobiaceae bacterium]|nr:FAD-binding oxidoreductase [Desulfohalobiaceae bacterium]
MSEQKSYDVVIVGGGVMGSSLAYHLTGAESSLKVAVVERDPTYERASTTLSMVNFRIQFSLKENVEISRYTSRVFEDFEKEMQVGDTRPNIALCREGNLFMVDEEARPAAEASLKMQQGLGCEVAWLDPDGIRARYPLYDAGQYSGGTFGPQDGHFDAYAVLMAYKNKAVSQGAAFIADEVSGLNTSRGRIGGVQLASGGSLQAGYVVNCAGAWAAEIAAQAGVSLPVDPVKRQVFALDPEVKPDGPLPLTILRSGLYFRTETGGLLLVGKSKPDDPIGFDFTWDRKRFMEELWLELAEFVPAFESLKLVRGWAGLYAVNQMDGNALLGEWPELAGFYLANGFSGHGLQQAPAVGRYISELILDKAHALDLSVFDPSRVLENKPLSEGGLV